MRRKIAEVSGKSDRDELFYSILTGFSEKLGFEILLKTDPKVAVSCLCHVDVLAVIPTDFRLWFIRCSIALQKSCRYERQMGSEF